MEEENEEPDSYAGVEIRVIAMKSKELLLIYKVYLRTDFALKCFLPWPFIIYFEAIWWNLEWAEVVVQKTYGMATR